MRATGIVRRIDDLGRVVIPKEIRRTLRIRESEPLEIFTGKEGEIVLKKYSPISEMTGFAKQYMESLSQVSGRIAVVADRDQFIAVSGGMRSLLGKEISKELENKIKTIKNETQKEHLTLYSKINSGGSRIFRKADGTIIRIFGKYKIEILWRICDNRETDKR